MRKRKRTRLDTNLMRRETQNNIYMYMYYIISFEIAPKQPSRVLKFIEMCKSVYVYLFFLHIMHFQGAERKKGVV